MGRLYIELECGCLISCNGGGGLMPCDEKDCKASEYMDEHKSCKVCGDCLVCYDHGECGYKAKDLLYLVGIFLGDLIEDGYTQEISTEEIIDRSKELLKDVKKFL